MWWLALAAATAAEPAWTLDLGESPWPWLSDAGVLLLATPTEVLGVDTSDGSLRWRRPQAESVRGDLFQPLPWTSDVLLATYATGPDTFEIVDVTTGVAAWTAPPGEVVLGAWPSPTGPLVLTDRVDEPGHFALLAVDLASGATRWRVDDALRGPPPIGPTRSARTAALTARASPGPWFVDGHVLTAWSPLDGFARRGPDGAVRWRLVVPGAERLLPADGFAEPIVQDGTLYAPVRADRVAALDVVTGAPRWKPAAGRVRGYVGHLERAGSLVVVAGGDRIEALRAQDGRSSWRVGVGLGVQDLAVAGDLVVAVDADGVVHGLSADGSVRFQTPVADGGAVSLDVVDGVPIARLEGGAVALDPATGAVRWRTAPEGALPEESPWARVSGDLGDGLYREPPPADHPTRTEHVFVVIERRDGRSVAVLHRVDLRTGAASSVPLDTANPRWLWDPHTGTAIVVHREGRIEAFRP